MSPSWLLLAMFTLASGQTGPGIPCICLEEMPQPGNSTINVVTSIANAGDGSGRLFLSELEGLVWMWKDGVRTETPFLDVSDDIVVFEGGTGFYDLTFHPDHESNGLLYTMHQTNESGLFYINLVEYQVSATNPDLVDKSTSRTLFSIQCGAQFTSPCDHVGGLLMFGPDGYMYFGIGDGQGQEDQGDDAQDLTNYKGSIHRIDVNSRTGDLEYGIPADNPYLSDPTVVPETYNYGWRQPYSGCMDKGDKNTGYGYGRMYVGEVGQDAWEEINEVTSGGNYGWAAFEGPDCYKPEFCNITGPTVAPIVEYSHQLGVCVMLGDVYRGDNIPDLNGWMLFGDWGSSIFMGAYETTPDQWAWQQMPMCSTCPEGLTNQYPYFIHAMGSDDVTGEHYVSAGDTYNPSGGLTRLFKIWDPNSWTQLHN